jgi:hypothetical protein
LLLRGPELVVVGTDYSRRLLRCHCYTYDHRAAYAQSPAAPAQWPLILLPADEPKYTRQDYAQIPHSAFIVHRFNASATRAPMSAGLFTT